MKLTQTVEIHNRFLTGPTEFKGRGCELARRACEEPRTEIERHRNVALRGREFEGGTEQIGLGVSLVHARARK